MDDGSSPAALAAVRVFEAAARLGSFTQAAQELGMTQAAVSYQIRVLEQRVGTPLFLRTARRVLLTEAGQRLSPAVTLALTTIRTAFAAVREEAEGALSLSVLHTFAANWLGPRLGRFGRQHPWLALRLNAANELVDFTRSEVDAGIRLGRGPWPGLVAHHLFRSRFTPLCSPDLLARSGTPATPADLLRLPLLTPADSWWARWFELAGVDPGNRLGERSGIRFDSQQVEGNAALAGEGVAILGVEFWRPELAAGRLVQPFPLLGEDGSSFWLVYPESRARARKLRAFRDWLLAEVRTAMPTEDSR